QKYYFDPTFGGALQPGSKVVFDPTISLTGFAFAQGRRLSPLVSVLKFAPFSNYDTELRADFNPSGGGVLNAGITSRVHRGPLGTLRRENVFRVALSLANVGAFGNLRSRERLHLQ